jgi:hypothetical protein
MKLQLAAPVLVATLTLSSALGLTSTVQANPPVDNSAADNVPVDNSEISDSAINGTKFSCVPENNGNVATIGQRPGGQPIPLIIWTKKASDENFGGKYSPQKRCDIVTPKLNKAVADSGGSLKDVVLMTGKIGSNTVICAVSMQDDGCNKNNVLLTLKPENAEKAEEILAQIVKISREGSSVSAVEETTQKRVQINLGDWAKSTMRNQIRKPRTSK